MRCTLIMTALTLSGCSKPLVVKDYLNLVSISPNHGATAVSVDVQIIAGFSEPLVASSVDSQTAYLADTDGGPVIATATYESGAHWIILDPENALAPTTTYVVTFNSGIEGKESGPLLAPVQTRFTTAGTHPSNALPTANAGEDQAVSVGATVSIDGSQSADLEDATLSYVWRLVSTPANSAIALSTLTGPITTLVPDAEGEIIIGLIVNDGLQDSSEDFVIVRALGTSTDTGSGSDTATAADTGAPTDTGAPAR